MYLVRKSVGAVTNSGAVDQVLNNDDLVRCICAFVGNNQEKRIYTSQPSYLLMVMKHCVLSMVNMRWHACSKHFRQVTLGGDSALRFCNDASFRERMVNFVADPSKQIIVCLDGGNRNGLVDISGLAGMNTVIVKNCLDLIDISPLFNVPFVEIHGCHSITDVSALRAASEVLLYLCPGISKGVDELGGVKKLSIIRDRWNWESPDNIYKR